jgi:hypothetical protein
MLLPLCGLLAQDDIIEHAIIDADNLEKRNINGSVEYVDFKSFQAEKFKIRDSLIRKKRPYTFFHERTYFDSIGRVKREVNFANNSGIEYEYDSLNRVVKVLSIDTETFEILGERLLNWIQTDSTLSVSAEEPDTLLTNMKVDMHYEMDRNGNVVELHKIVNGNYSSKYTFVYDSLNRVTRSTWYGSGGTVIHNWTYSYDKKNRLIQRTKRNGEGIINEERIFKYDSIGNKIEDKSTRFIYTWEYEYDSQNNWVQSTRFKNGVKTHIVIREIEYH